MTYNIFESIFTTVFQIQYIRSQIIPVAGLIDQLTTVKI